MATRRMTQDQVAAAVEAAKAVPPQAWGTPPAAVATLTLFGYPIDQAVQAVMLVWGLCSMIPLIWRGFRWMRRKGWRDA